MKTLYIYLFTLLFSCSIYGQIITFADPAFKNRLIEEGFDTNTDGNIQVSEAEAIELLGLTAFGDDEKITNLDGIEFFTNIKYLGLNNNELSTVDLGNNPLIEELALANNLLSEIDVSVLPNLRLLFVDGNSLSELDISDSNSLEWLTASGNFLSSLNLSNKPTLEFLEVNSNFFTEIDASNTGISLLHCENNPDLLSIDVANNVISQADPDLLYFPFRFDDTPSLATIRIDCEEEEALTYSDYDEGTVDVNCIFSIEDNLLNKITISPNPIDQSLSIANENLISQFALYSISGKILVKTEKFQQIKERLFNVQSGIFLLEVTGNNGTKKVIRLVKD